ncbi:MAG: ABATE domain-containing protein [Chloroflexota bacterium]|nr:ABATE domain-containing protein [Chloroflexota bacterium]
MNKDQVYESSEVVDTSTRLDNLRFLSGRLCLDFANTVDPRVGQDSHDFLSNYFALVKWSQRISVLTEDEAAGLIQDAKHHPTEATTTFERAINLRETMYRVFSAVARRAIPRSADLDTLKRAFAAAMTHARIMPTDDSFEWDWNKNENALDMMLWPLARSAVELLISSEVKRVKECPGVGDCGWLFLDTSKNGSRQWCSMEGCGSRAKMRRQYARKRTIRVQHTK